MSTSTNKCCNTVICTCGKAYQTLSTRDLSNLVVALGALVAERLAAAEHKPFVREWTPGQLSHPLKRSPRPFPVEPALVKSVDDLPDHLHLASMKESFADPTDTVAFRPLVFGGKFSFSEVNDETPPGVWTVSAITGYDTHNGPELTVFSVEAKRRDRTIKFFTSFSTELVDDTMVPFTPMSNIKHLPSTWDRVRDSEVALKAPYKVGGKLKINGGSSNEHGLITHLHYFQLNQGIPSPDEVICLAQFTVTRDVPQTESGFSCALHMTCFLIPDGIQEPKLPRDYTHMYASQFTYTDVTLGDVKTLLGRSHSMDDGRPPIGKAMTEADVEEGLTGLRLMISPEMRRRLELEPHQTLITVCSMSRKGNIFTVEALAEGRTKVTFCINLGKELKAPYLTVPLTEMAIDVSHPRK